MLAGRTGWFGTWRLWDPPGKRLRWWHLPSRGSQEPTLGCSPPREAAAQECGALRCGLGSDSPRLENSSGALPLPSVCSGLSAGLQPSCCCADANVCPMIFPASVCATKICSAPCSQHSVICPCVLPWALSCSWALSWPSDVSFPHAGVDASIFGSRQGLRSSLGSCLQLKLIRLYWDMAVLWIAHIACQITWVSLPLFHGFP